MKLFLVFIGVLVLFLGILIVVLHHEAAIEKRRCQDNNGVQTRIGCVDKNLFR